jgi:mRNA-degrading endonuclease RelE of RelBE toxin-antitoxin system
VKHLTLPRFWKHYEQLPKEVQEVADKSFELLKADPHHPSLHLKKIGGAKELWSVRVGAHYRALGVEKAEGIVWFWIGSHADYDRMLS